MKRCTGCNEEKSLTLFGFDKRPGRGQYARCKDCRKAELQVYRENNREKVREYERAQYALKPHKRSRHLKSKYGITHAQYELLLAHQLGKCKICDRSAELLKQTLAVDHDHSTGAIRGLLCAECNRLLGCARDRPDVLDSARRYLINAEAATQFIAAYLET